jgi:putative DNA primase/helicase
MATSPQISISHNPPTPLQVQPGGTPDVLKMYPCWVNWRYAWDGKKWTKHPYDPRIGRKASSTDLLTWSTFEEVLEAYEAGSYDGIGFVFCSANPYIGVDLDNCVDPETGEIEAWADEIIESLDAYTELSPSGTGIHIIAKGKIPRSGRRGPVEMYAQDRFFAITGHVLGDLT